VPAGAATGPMTTRSVITMLDDSSRSADAAVCPFFRREVDGRLYVPLASPDEENVCAAIGVPKPQSARQQELVCLRAAHAECPRYLRGALSFPDVPKPRRQAPVPRATLAALLILVLSAGISFGFVVQRGGIDLPVVDAGAVASPVALVTTPPPTQPATEAPVTAAPSATGTAPASASPSPTPTVAPTPEPSPTATPKPTPRPTPKPTKKPTSARYALLTACPDRADCWIYRVRSGDNLFSIAKYFGHSLTTIYRWNPQYPATALQVGAKIRMPPPTR
jgi:hypothetical protein